MDLGCHRNNLENIAIENDLQRISIEELAAFGIITKEEKDAQLLQLEKERLNAQLEEQKRLFGESSNEAKIASHGNVPMCLPFMKNLLLKRQFCKRSIPRKKAGVRATIMWSDIWNGLPVGA